MASPDALDLAALEGEIPTEGLARTLFEELKRLRNATNSEPTSRLTKRAIALLKDYDLFTDLRTTKSCLSGASRSLNARWRGYEANHPLIVEIADKFEAFERSVETAEFRLIEEHQDA